MSDGSANTSSSQTVAPSAPSHGPAQAGPPLTAPGNAGALPQPIIERRRWPVALIWIVPVLALIAAGFYYHERWVEHSGVPITLKLEDASGIKVDETVVQHRGVPIGKVKAIELSPDNRRVLLHVRLLPGAEDFGRKGAMFWIVRPEFSAENVSGLTTLFSGPVVESAPGSGDYSPEFSVLPSRPVAMGQGERFMLHSPRRGSIQAGSPIYYHGIEVGVVEDVQLSSDAVQLNVPIFIRHRYAALVRTDSVFWTVGGADIQGGILTGVRVRVESLRSLLAGGITFATPTTKFGPLADPGTEFPLADEAKKDWLTWSPVIALPPTPADEPATKP